MMFNSSPVTAGKLDAIIFRLAGGPVRIEVPRQAHNFLERLPASRRPAQYLILRTLNAGLHEVTADPQLRLDEYKSDRLLA